MRAIKSVYLVLFTFVFVHIALADQIEINIKDKVTLKEKTITISDISTVVGDDVALVNRINNIEIGRTPWPNNQRRIGAEYMMMRLRALNINLSDIIFKGAKAVIVSVESTKITGAEIAQKAKEYLLSVITSKDRETIIELVRIPGDQWVTKRRDEIVLSVSLADNSKNRGNIEVIVSAPSDDIPFFKIPVFFKVRVFENVAIAKRRINSRQPLTSENVFLGKRETTETRGLAYSSLEDLVDKVAIRTILPNTIITEEILETPPAIKRGNVVKLFIKADNFSIITKGLAQETGYTGEVIKFKNLDTEKVIYGKIIDSENVQIVF
ncbi:MAG: flagellar basal body P-ring formation chaperone FlgA [Candidatus Scalinduaceae bacterium]